MLQQRTTAARREDPSRRPPAAIAALKIDGFRTKSGDPCRRSFVAASARSSKASIIPQGCDERSGDVDTGHGTFEAVARRKEHCGLVYGAIRQFDPSEPMA